MERWFLAGSRRLLGARSHLSCFSLACRGTVDADSVGLYLAGFFFLVGLFFWVGCIRSRDRKAKVMAFWYAVIFENAGFVMLVVYRVTSR